MNQKPQSIDDAITALIPVVKPIVDAIEASMPTTKDHYDKYMVAISRVAGLAKKENDRGTCLAVAVAMQRAGASQAGTTSALRIMGHI